MEGVKEGEKERKSAGDLTSWVWLKYIWVRGSELESMGKEVLIVYIMLLQELEKVSPLSQNTKLSEHKMHTQCKPFLQVPFCRVQSTSTFGVALNGLIYREGLAEVSVGKQCGKLPVPLTPTQSLHFPASFIKDYECIVKNLLISHMWRARDVHSSESSARLAVWLWTIILVWHPSKTSLHHIFKYPMIFYIK